MRLALSRGHAPPVLACVFLVAGCATNQQTASLECGAGGAAVAYVACKALGGTDANCARFAVVGGGVGAVACYSYAGRLEKRRQQLAGQENNLDARLRYVRGLNEDSEKLNAELRGRVEVASKRSDELQAQMSKSRVSADVLAKERSRLDGELKAANDQVALQRDALTEVKTFQAKRTTADLDAEIAKQDRLLADARRQVETLASFRERV